MSDPAAPCLELGAAVLVVDDDVDIRETISMILEDEGYTVACASNGREALDYLREHRAPNLILLDLMMPVMDGVEFCNRQRQDPRLANIPVVIVTASGQAKEQSAALNAKAFIYKPLALDTLLEKVEQWSSRTTT
ncbi:response regulator [Pendulispora brunnea]|uniref:Response regulator n=1 Tax=Pendulispora brunnea TaxID=2905690 RepID=A0ABZ2KJL4_9BACT